MDADMSALVLVRGVPGAGKTTWAKKNLSDLQLIEADQFRELSGTYVYNEKHQTIAHQWVVGQVIDCLAKGRACVVTGTYVKLDYIRPLKEVAKKFGAIFRIVELDGGFESVHEGATKEVIASLRKKYEPLPEGGLYGGDPVQEQEV